MGAFSGSTTYSLYFVDGELPSEFKDRYLQMLKKRAFEPLTTAQEEEETSGWVPIRKPLQTIQTTQDFVFNEFIAVGLRTDRWSIPGELFRARYAEAEEEYRQKNDLSRLSKIQREDIKKLVRKRLKEQSLPSMKVIDMAWDLDSMRLRFFSQSARVMEIFEEFFEDTFELRLRPASPYILAMEIELSDEALEGLTTVEPSNFVTGDTTSLYYD